MNRWRLLSTLVAALACSEVFSAMKVGNEPKAFIFAFLTTLCLRYTFKWSLEFRKDKEVR